MSRHLLTRAMLISAMAASTATAQAGPVAGLNPQSAGQFAAERAPAPTNAPTMQLAAERLRAGMVLNPRAFLAAQGADEQTAVVGAFGQIGDREATHLAWYFRGALTRTLVPGANSVLYYNPIADVAALTTWRRIDGVWRLTSARLIDGAALRASDRDFWADDQGLAYRQALATHARASLTSEGEYRDAVAGGSAFETLRRRSNAIQVGLAAWRTDAARSAASENVRRSLAAAVNPAPEGPSRAQLQALSPDVRRTLALTAVFRRADGDSLAFVSPLQPELLIFVDLDAAHRPLRTGPVNLANLQG